MKIRIWIYALCILFLASPAAGKIYKWKDDNGKTHFTDNPGKIPKKFRENLNVVPDAPAPVKTPPRTPFQYKKNVDALNPDDESSPDDSRLLDEINKRIKKADKDIKKLKEGLKQEKDRKAKFKRGLAQASDKVFYGRIDKRIKKYQDQLKEFDAYKRKLLKQKRELN